MKKSPLTQKFNGKVYTLMAQTKATRPSSKTIENLKKSGYKKIRKVIIPASDKRPKFYRFYVRKS